MAIEEAFERLVGTFSVAEETFQGLHLTVNEDRPTDGAVLMVERLGNLVQDLRGWLAEGHAAAIDAREAVNHPLNGHRARQALGRANERFIRLEALFFNEAVSHRTIDGLERFGRTRGGEWFGWSGGVAMALQACREPLRALGEAILRAWQELSERLGAGSLLVQNTNVGQQIAPAILAGTQAGYESGFGKAT
ncbi:MAG TPA: hypothetical protein VMU81_25425 [Acetobacteraceae bacterium]|nr:hypothetical protein [Acetobacteraceae bacterium]